MFSHRKQPICLYLIIQLGLDERAGCRGNTGGGLTSCLIFGASYPVD